MFWIQRHHLSFPVTHKVAMLAFLYCFSFENQIDIVVSHLNFNLKHHDKCKFVVELIRWCEGSNLFPLEVVQKCQHCQLCVLRKNSSTYHCIVELICTEGGNTRLDPSRPERYQRQPDKRDKPTKQQPFKGFMVYSHLRLVEIS